MNKLPLLNTVLIIIALVFSVFSFFKVNEEKVQELVIIDSIKLFSEFNMTKEIKAVEEEKLLGLKNTIDSLFIKYNGLKNKTTDNGKTLEVEITKKRQQFAQIQENFNQKLTQQIWNRIDSYIEDYSKENKYKVILGANGTSNIMHADEKIDVTTEFLNYVNAKYEGNLNFN